MNAHMAPPAFRRLILTLTLAGLLLATAAAADSRLQDPARAGRLRATMEEARKDGAKGQLPNTWWDLDSRLGAAEKDGATAVQWDALENEVKHLRSATAFVTQMRRQKSGIEALLGRYDQSLREIGALYGVAPDPTLSGTPAATDLLARLNAANLARQVLVDSLTVVNRRLNETVGTKVVYQDSLITALQVEASALRKKLWETELRVGVAEADRSAAESVLVVKQEREAAIAGIQAAFSKDEGEILLTPAGEVVMRVHSIAFGVGSADLAGGQQALLAKIADAVRRFPGAPVRIEGHTDDTGSRSANLRLSRRRAETVARLLEKELGLASEEITTEGFGPDRPVALNSTPEGRARNRRIDVVIGAPR